MDGADQQYRAQLSTSINTPFHAGRGEEGALQLQNRAIQKTPVRRFAPIRTEAGVMELAQSTVEAKVGEVVVQGRRVRADRLRHRTGASGMINGAV